MALYISTHARGTKQMIATREEGPWILKLINEARFICFRKEKETKGKRI